MQLFIHYKIQQVESFLAKLSKLNALYSKNAFEFSKQYHAVVSGLIDYFEQIGDSKNQAEVEQLKNYYQTAEEGIDPTTLQKLRTGKRTMVRASAFHCLSGLSSILQQALLPDKEKLEQASQTLGNLVLSLVQGGAITTAELSKSLTQQEVETIWARVSQNEQVKLHERSLRLTITKDDILLLLADIIEKIKD